MDAVYGSYNLQASPEICVKDYFKEYIKLLSTVHHDTSKSAEEQIIQLMGSDLPTEKLSLMARYCSINNLKVSTEITNDEEDNKMTLNVKSNVPSDNIQLETIKVLKTNNDVPNKNKHIDGFEIKYSEELQNLKIKPTVIPGYDILIYVRVYEPFKYTLQHIDVDQQHIPILRLKTIIVMLGRQYLSELRDKIQCISDLSISTEISGNPNKKSEEMAKDIYKSGFIFIEDTFYNDTRDPTNINYSDVIVNWAKMHNVGPFKTASMENVQIGTLQMRFGFPWVYQHQGCCEHLIVLSDARLVNKEDDLLAINYPRIVKIKPAYGKNCIMCGILNVRWVTTEHDRVPHDTSYFCDNCFKSYNYIDGKKIGNFKAYRYPCIPELMENKRKPLFPY